jgi:hypothetical protein
MAARTAAGYRWSWRMWKRPNRQEVGFDNQISLPFHRITLHPPANPSYARE